MGGAKKDGEGKRENKGRYQGGRERAGSDV